MKERDRGPLCVNVRRTPPQRVGALPTNLRSVVCGIVELDRVVLGVREHWPLSRRKSKCAVSLPILS